MEVSALAARDSEAEEAAAEEETAAEDAAEPQAESVSASSTAVPEARIIIVCFKKNLLLYAKFSFAGQQARMYLLYARSDKKETSFSCQPLFSRKYLKYLGFTRFCWKRRHTAAIIKLPRFFIAAARDGKAKRGKT